MNAAEISTMASQGSLYYTIKTVLDVNGITVINGYIALPVTATASYFTSNEDIDVKSDQDVDIGTLCFCKAIGEKVVNNLPYLRYLAYLTEVDEGNFVSLTYNFKYDYFLIKASKYKKYIKKHMSTSSIWGGFVHEDTYQRILPKPIHNDPSTITIFDLKLPTAHHEASAMRSVIEPYAFERYLKLYHLLELVFDWDIVQKIKTLNDDLLGIGQILSAYKGKELQLLINTLTSRCNNITAIALKMDNVKIDLNTSKTIFFEYNKDGNPLQYETLTEIITKGGFAIEANIIKPGNLKPGAYGEKIIAIACYWIYRIRCSIAHNRIGEYVMVQSDEKYLVDFAEPLLREVVIQCFKT